MPNHTVGRAQWSILVGKKNLSFYLMKTGTLGQRAFPNFRFTGMFVRANFRARAFPDPSLLHTYLLTISNKRENFKFFDFTYCYRKTTHLACSMVNQYEDDLPALARYT